MATPSPTSHNWKSKHEQEERRTQRGRQCARRHSGRVCPWCREVQSVHHVRTIAACSRGGSLKHNPLTFNNPTDPAPLARRPDPAGPLAVATPTTRKLADASISRNTRRAYLGALRRLDAWRGAARRNARFARTAALSPGPSPSGHKHGTPDR